MQKKWAKYPKGIFHLRRKIRTKKKIIFQSQSPAATVHRFLLFPQRNLSLKGCHFPPSFDLNPWG